MTSITYQPTPTEIEQMINRGKVKHRAHAFLYDDAGNLLKDGHIGFAFGNWYCLSQRDATQLCTIADGRCNCPSFGLYAIEQRIYCKHTIAYFALTQILIVHFNQRILGTTFDTTAIERYRAQPNTWLLQHCSTPSFLTWNGHNGQFVCYAYPLPTPECPSRLAPANPYQFAQFSSWLAHANHHLPT